MVDYAKGESMARTADQIVAEQLGHLHLQLVIAQSRYEAAEEKSVELSTRVSVLEAQLANEKSGVGSPPEEFHEATAMEEVRGD